MNVQRLSFLAIFLCGLQAQDLPGAEPDELLTIAAHRSLITELFKKPITETQSIDEKTRGTIMQGSAITAGTLTAEPYPSRDGVGLRLQFLSKTDATSINRNDARKDIAVGFQWTIETNACTQKNLLLRESGFTESSAQTSAASEITWMGDLRAQAQGILPGRRIEASMEGSGRGVHRVAPGSSAAMPIQGRGLLPRVKANVALTQAQEKLRSTKYSNEREIGEKISKQLSTKVDEKAKEMLAPIHETFLTYVQGPFITRGLLGGRFGGGSNEEWIVFRGTASSEIQPVDVAASPDFLIPRKEGGPVPLVLRANKKFIERFAEMRLGGTEMTEVEMAQLLGGTNHLEAEATEDLIQSKDEILFTLEEQKPILIDFDEDRIHLTFRWRHADVHGKHFEHVLVKRRIEIRSEGEQTWIVQHPPHEVTAYGAIKLDEAAAKQITARFARVLPKAPQSIGDTVFLKTIKPMHLVTLRARHGLLTAGIALVKP